MTSSTVNWTTKPVFCDSVQSSVMTGSVNYGSMLCQLDQQRQQQIDGVSRIQLEHASLQCLFCALCDSRPGRSLEQLARLVSLRRWVKTSVVVAVDLDLQLTVIWKYVSLLSLCLFLDCAKSCRMSRPTLQKLYPI